MFWSIADNVEALQDIWVIGSCFLRSIANTFVTLKNQAKINKKPLPYFDDYYNARCFYQYTANSHSTNAYAALLNSLIEAMNQFARLPAYIIFIPDWDICTTISRFSYGVSNVIHTDSKYLFDEITVLLKHRKEDLLSKKMGAIASMKESKIIWVEMIDRPPTKDHHTKNKIIDQRSKYNFITNELAADAGHFVMDIASCKSTSHFDRQSHLTSHGKEVYWKELDFLFKKFDRGELSLLPKKLRNDRQKKLPTPPPRR